MFGKADQRQTEGTPKQIDAYTRYQKELENQVELVEEKFRSED